MLKKLFVLTLFVSVFGVIQDSKNAWAEQTEYTFGVVPQYEIRKLAAIWLPILTELETRTGLKFRLAGAYNIPDFEDNFIKGDFDFAYMNPYHSRLAHKNQGYTPLVRDDGQRLFGILVTSKTSGLENVQQLEGKKIAFPAPNALGASLVIRADLDQLYQLSYQPKYVHTHSSVYLNVALGKVAAGGGVMGSLSTQPDEIKDKLVVLYKTRSMASHPVVAHPRVPPEHQELVRKAFLEIGETQNGARLLAKIPIRHITAAAPADYQELNEWGLEHYVE
ncbi:MAG: phosphate/phosphite/phosphonate ABC transporter substrate-binding protein [Nitrosomonas sp.]|nr:phosphate/phosphite/phosphonate ABC transporter substrate-binding protein [Nitrosomonas sp.]